MVTIACRRTVTGVEDQPREVTLEVRDGRISRVSDGIAPGAELVDGWLVPGFVDTHCHGAAGADFTDPDPQKVQRAIAHHRAHGTTTQFASTVTSSIEALVEQIGRMRPLVESGELAGIHVEGPFLAAARKGAHPTELLMDPTPDAIDHIVEASHGSVRMVTLAPERESGLDAIRRLAAEGIAPAFGHSDADGSTTKQAVEAGANVATHLFNAMRPVHHRDPGPVPVLLNDQRVGIELICDGVHLHPEVVSMAIEAAGRDRTMLVTDAMSATGCADGSYQLGAMPVQVKDHTARILNLDGTPGAIAGSTLTMDRAFAFVLACGKDVVTASRLASTTPARVHGLHEVGTLEVGRWADACVVGEDGELLRVMRRGQWLDGATS